MPPRRLTIALAVLALAPAARADAPAAHETEVRCEDGKPAADTPAVLRWGRSGLGYESLLLAADRTVMVWQELRGATPRTCRQRLSQADFDRTVAAVRRLELCKLHVEEDSAIVMHELRLELGPRATCRVRTTDRRWRRQPRLVSAEKLVLGLRASVCAGGCPSGALEPELE